MQLWREGALLRYHGVAADVDPLLPDLVRFKPALLELLSPDVDAATGTETPDDAIVRELLARYRRGGAVLSLEEIEHASATWLALACDLSGVSEAKRERAFVAMQNNARQLQRALELESTLRQEIE